MKASELIAHLETGGAIVYRSAIVPAHVSANRYVLDKGELYLEGSVIPSKILTLLDLFVDPNEFLIVIPKKKIVKKVRVHFGENISELGFLYKLLGINHVLDGTSNSGTKCRITLEEL